jgi:uncharacterized membrane protein YbaN (DUF454 family)
MKKSKINTRLLQFRLKQIGKFLKETPPPYQIILLTIAGITLYTLHTLLNNPTNALIYGAILTATVALTHLRRKDHHFIQLANQPAWPIYLTDYLLFTLPLLLLLVWKGHILITLGTITTYTLISTLKQPRRQTTKHFPVPTYIPPQAFEIRTLIRRHGMPLLILYLSAYAATPIPYLTFAPLWLSIALIFEGFKDCEPRALLNTYEMPPHQFLYHKISLTLKIYTIATMPVCLIYTIIHPSHWWITTAFFIMALLTTTLTIIHKYAKYEPNTEIVSGQTSLGLSFIGIIIPLLAPLTLLLLIRYYQKAHKNLTPYLYAYH